MIRRNFMQTSFFQTSFISNSPISLMCLLWVCVLVASADVIAKEKSVASIVRVVGEVSATGLDGDTRKLHIQQQIYSGDKLVTGKGGWLTVNFYDLTRVVLRPETEFHIVSFPITMDAGDIDLKIVRGGVRITSGTIASKTHERFTLVTPSGNLHAGRAEWVVRVCDGERCESERKKIKQCNKYQKPMLENSEVVSVYLGQVTSDRCEGRVVVEKGSSNIFDTQTQRCDVIDQVPCFVLFDGKMGKDKIRDFLKKLTLDDGEGTGHEEDQVKEGERPESRHSRPVSRTRRTTPGIDRPRRNRR